MKSKKLTIAVSAALFCANINILPVDNENYYEDDADFYESSSKLKSGWGWSIGFNNLKANSDEHGCDTAERTDCDVMKVQGTRIEKEEPDYTLFFRNLLRELNDQFYGLSAEDFQRNGQLSPNKSVIPEKCSSANPKGGNPIQISDSRKVQLNTDVIGRGTMPVILTREYKYGGVENRYTGLFGRQGVSNIDDLGMSVIEGSWTNPAIVSLIRYSGEQLILTKKYVEVESTQETEDTQAYQLEARWFDKNDSEVHFYQSSTNSNQWNLVEGGFTEVYNNIGDEGVLKSIKHDPSGEKIDFLYDANEPTRIRTLSHNNGDKLSFTYNSQGYIKTVSLPSYENFYYTYNSYGDLIKLSTPKNDSDTQDTSNQDTRNVEEFLYEELGQNGSPLMTGILDKNGDRFATWEWEYASRAIKSYHGNNQEVFKIIETKQVHNTPYQKRTVLTENALGKRTTYTFEKQAKTYIGEPGEGYWDDPYEWNVVKVEGHASDSCLAANKSYEYSNNYELLLSKTNWTGKKTAYEYDTKKRVIKETTFDNNIEYKSISYEWHDPTAQLSKITDENLTTEFTFDSLGRLETRSQKNTSENGVANQTRTWNYNYTTHGNGLIKTKSIDGPRTDINDTYVYHYDSKGNLIELQTPPSIGYSTYYTDYNFYGTPKTITLPDGTVNKFTYGRLGWLMKAEYDFYGDKRTTIFSYDAVGQISSIVNAEGLTTYFYYDSAHRLVKSATGGKHYVSYEYDPASNLTSTLIKELAISATNCNFNDEKLFSEACISISDKVIKSDKKTYDELSRLKSIISGSQIVSSFEYGIGEHPTTVKDAKGKGIYNAYDSLGRLKTSTDRNGGVTQYFYNKNSLVSKLTDPNGNSTYYYYDGFGNLIRQVSPDTGNTRFEYDEAGNMVKKIDAKGNVITFVYDALNRIVSSSIGHNYEYDLDRKGYLNKVTDNSGVQYYSYNAHGEQTEKTSVIDGESFTLKWQYNKAGQITKEVRPNNVIVDYMRNQLGNVVSIKVNGNQLISNASYKPFGPVTNFTFGNGLLRTYSRDNRYRLTGLYTPGVMDLSLSYDLNSNISQIDDTHSTRLQKYKRYVYDNNERLISSNDYGVSSLYTYDNNGNRLTKNSTNYIYALNSNILEKVQEEPVITDANGSITSIGNKYYYYNENNRMRRFVQGNNIADYTYNSEGERVKKSFEGVNTYYSFSSSGELIYKKSRNIEKNYIYFEGELVGYLKNNELYFVISDYMGRPEVVVNNAKSEVWRAENRAFDRIIKKDNIQGFEIGFPGQYYDEEKDNWYNYYRDYDSSLGRYIQSDPIGQKGGINTYIYAEQNPISYIDPLGLNSLSKCLNPANAAACRAAGMITKPKLPKLQTPKKPKGRGLVTCTCRAIANQHSISTSNGDVKTAFGTATDKSLAKCQKKAKTIAKRALGQQPKHDSCVCVDSKGKITRTKGG